MMANIKSDLRDGKLLCHETKQRINEKWETKVMLKSWKQTWMDKTTFTDNIN
jgi:hypothetical protein